MKSCKAIDELACICSVTIMDAIGPMLEVEQHPHALDQIHRRIEAALEVQRIVMNREVLKMAPCRN